MDVPAGCKPPDECVLCNYGLWGRNLWPKRLYFSTFGRASFGWPDWVNEPMDVEGDPPFRPCEWRFLKDDPMDPTFTWDLGVVAIGPGDTFTITPVVSSFFTGVVGYNPASLFVSPTSVTPFRIQARVYGPNRLVFPFRDNPLWVVVSEDPI